MSDLGHAFMETFTAAAAFVGTCAFVAALTNERPLPVETFVAAGCAAFIVAVVVIALLSLVRGRA